MGKTVESIVFVVAAVAVAVFAPEIAGIIGVAGALGTSAAVATALTATVLEVGLALAQTALLGPSIPKGLLNAVSNQMDRLYVSMDMTTPRKIVFGDTAGATDLRYQSYTGTKQRYYEQIIAVASHKVNSIYEIWFDNEKAWTSAGGVQGRYVGFLTVDVRNEGTSANGIAIDSTWTTACTLTGCAYIHLKFDLLGTATDGSNNSPFASGVTTRVTVRTQGAFVYDPRLDSTVSGGSGAHRANNQSTWAWSSSASRNPALQLLWYLLGWQIGGKLAVGMGLPASRIDLASFAVAANACDASITLNGGGTEPRYRCDGVVGEADPRNGVIEALCATMNAMLRDAGGKISLTVLVNDLSTPVASFNEGDVMGGEQWDQSPDITNIFNICRGRRVDPSDNSLYQLVDVPEAALTSNDGIDRIDTMDMPFVQSNGQAQRLLKQRLQRNQYQGKYTLTGKPRWWQVSVGDVVQFSHQSLGWSNKLFRIASQSIVRTGETKITMVEESSAIYAWSNNESAAVTPGAPTVYDPSNSPLIQGMNNFALNGTTAAVFLYKRSATTPTLPSVSTTYTFATGILTGADNGWTQSIPAANGNPLYVTVATAFANAGTDTIASSEWASPVILVNDGTAGLNSASVFIYKRSASAPALPSVSTTYTFATGVLTGLNNGWTQAVPAANGNPLYVSFANAPGTGTTDSIPSSEWAAASIMAQDGTDAVIISVNPPAITIAADSAGATKAGQFNKTAQIVVMNGQTNVSASATYGTLVASGCSATVNSSGLITITAMSSTGTATVTVPVSYGSVGPQNVVVTLTKSWDGATGGGGGSLPSGAIEVAVAAGSGSTDGFQNIAVTNGTLYFDGSVVATWGAGTGTSATLALVDDAGTVVFTIATATGANSGTPTKTTTFSNSYATGLAAGVWKNWKLRCRVTNTGVGSSGDGDAFGTFHQ